jgi:hypothetical protein
MNPQSLVGKYLSLRPGWDVTAIDKPPVLLEQLVSRNTRCPPEPNLATGADQAFRGNLLLLPPH